ncbi:hypothetical protein [Denitrobaculum tricleocarpae]|uniref:Uncharacterized protein n=1 Tax=Denitrobaculum tricleocarpae TaxID=2591009 RepID=A0A545T5N9_9PROT|nr:hypothetical protein [Denitrobaculum tricleocarpae]TQV72472.1 hypothetical protein FKG95_25720 [Denitrobaculum tricleocarpae]
MNGLNASELDLLERIDAKHALQSVFFRKAKGLKWFVPLFERGYFDKTRIPKPKKVKDGKYIQILNWDALIYLLNTVESLSENELRELAPQLMQIIRDSTEFSRINEFSNYRVWCQLSKVLSILPPDCISLDDIECVDYWLDDKYDAGLVAEIIGEKWLISLLNGSTNHSLALAERLLSVLLAVNCQINEQNGRDQKNVSFRYEHYYGEKIVEVVSPLVGRRLGESGVLVFQSGLIEAVDFLDNDSWSCIWQPAVQEHEQNKHKNDAVNILVAGCRDSLEGYLVADPEGAFECIASMLKSSYQILNRIAIHTANKHFNKSMKTFDLLFDEKYFNSGYRHEIWHFLNINYGDFSEIQKQSVLNLIEAIRVRDDDGEDLVSATAYEKCNWLSAIKGHSLNEQALYNEAVAVAGSEPDHPDFSYYVSVGWVTHISPYEIDELKSLSHEELIEKVRGYEGKGGSFYEGESVEGLSKAIGQLFKESPLQYYENLGKFAILDNTYVYSIIEAYSSLWGERATLPWDDVWRYLLEFVAALAENDAFWTDENNTSHGHYIANRDELVGAIGRLLEAGAKSDDHAFDQKYHQAVENILKRILERQVGRQFDVNSDAVMVAINSPRGRCIEALINLSLRACRLEDKRGNGEHIAAWSHFQPYYEEELKRTTIGEYEFATLVVNYLPNFLYMSKSWVSENLKVIFGQDDHLRWLCAMQGYCYVNQVYQEVYEHLKESNSLFRALDEDVLSSEVKRKLIQNIALAYLSDFEGVDDNDSSINILLARQDVEELSHLIWFIWTYHKKNDIETSPKVIRLWLRMMQIVNPSSEQGRVFASNLCLWSVYVDSIDEQTRRLLMAVAPYAEEAYNSHEFIENLARLSNKQPLEVNKIWSEILERYTPTYPEKDIRRMLSNLVAVGAEGQREARDIVSKYLKNGVEGPALWLKDIDV